MRLGSKAVLEQPEKKESTQKPSKRFVKIDGHRYEVMSAKSFYSPAKKAIPITGKESTPEELDKLPEVKALHVIFPDRLDSLVANGCLERAFDSSSENDALESFRTTLKGFPRLLLHKLYKFARSGWIPSSHYESKVF